MVSGGDTQGMCSPLTNGFPPTASSLFSRRFVLFQYWFSQEFWSAYYVIV